MVGFTQWEGPDGGHLPADVRAFLDAGEPPVVVTLGSSGASARPEVFLAAARALDRAGARGMFLTSNDAIAEQVRTVTRDLHAVWPFVPLAPILRESRAVLHSGAHGSNALALLAGLPSVIVPCLFDQLWHGHRQNELGTGILVRKLRDLDGALHAVLHDDRVADRARTFAETLSAEEGTHRTSNEIEAFLRRNTPA